MVHRTTANSEIRPQEANDALQSKALAMGIAVIAGKVAPACIRSAKTVTITACRSGKYFLTNDAPTTFPSPMPTSASALSAMKERRVVDIRSNQGASRGEANGDKRGGLRSEEHTS